MACFGGLSAYRKNVFSKERKIHIFVAISWIIFVPVETHRKIRMLLARNMNVHILKHNRAPQNS